MHVGVSERVVVLTARVVVDVRVVAVVVAVVVVRVPVPVPVVVRVVVVRVPVVVVTVAVVVVDPPGLPGRHTLLSSEPTLKTRHDSSPLLQLMVRRTSRPRSTSFRLRSVVCRVRIMICDWPVA